MRRHGGECKEEEKVFHIFVRLILCYSLSFSCFMILYSVRSMSIITNCEWAKAQAQAKRFIKVYFCSISSLLLSVRVRVCVCMYISAVIEKETSNNNEAKSGEAEKKLNQIRFKIVNAKNFAMHKHMHTNTSHAQCKHTKEKNRCWCWCGWRGCINREKWENFNLYLM